MERELISAGQLQKLIKSGIENIREVQEDGVIVSEPAVAWNAPDSEGCNWHVAVAARNLLDYSGIQELFRDLRARYNLKK